MWNLCFLFFALVTTVIGFPKKIDLEEGDQCRLKSGGTGQCKKLTDCPSAVWDIDHNREWPLECSLENFNIIVCCDDLKTKKTETDTAVVPSAENLEEQPNPDAGKKAKEKCEEYSRWLDNPILIHGNSGKIPGECGIAYQKFVLGGNQSSPMEFPHMAHLGFGNEKNPTYQCGASLISEEYLLTAAHCLTAELDITVARLGINSPDGEMLIKIAERIPHPKYKSTSNYYDIALLRLEEPLTEFTNYMRPACLQTEKEIPKPEATASGWGRTSYKGLPSKVLLKVNLPVLSHSKCFETYKKRNDLERGIDEKSMLCAGYYNIEKDTCQGDSGGPLQTILTEPNCMYSIIGVTSFGIQCGISPGVYTRVSHYVSWIESIVWPDKQ